MFRHRDHGYGRRDGGTDSSHSDQPVGVVRPVPRARRHGGDRRRLGDRVPGGPRRRRRRRRRARPRREEAAVPADGARDAGHRPVACRAAPPGRPLRRGRLDVHRRGLGRPAGHLVARRAAEGRGRRRRRRHARGGGAAVRARRQGPAQGARQEGQGAGREPARRAARRQPRPAGAAARRDRGRPQGAAARLPGPRVRHGLRAAPDLGRPPARALRRLVRVLPALGGRRQGLRGRAAQRHLPHRDRAVAGRRRDGLRRRVPAADPPDRQGQPQGSQHRAVPRRSAARHRRARPGIAVGDRLRRGRPRRDPPGAGDDRGLRRLRRPHLRARHGDRARPRAAGRARPPVGHRAPGVVHHPRGRLDRLRREPAEEVPGHLPGQLRQRPRGHLRRGAPRRPALDLARRAHLPRRQPAHQAAVVLGADHR